MKAFFKKILEEVSLPKEDEKKILAETKKIVTSLKKILNRKIIVGGSLAKGTLIKKDRQDVDLFVIFNNEEETKSLENLLRKSGFDYSVFHGSRDYFQFEKDNILFEIIPLVKIVKKEKVSNVTDFSPLHVDYIKQRLKEKPYLTNEIKIAKAFFQAQEIYGAESYIKGFSGYAIEVMICYYKSFLNLLKRIQKEDFVDIEKHFKNKNEATREINEQKILSPLIVIDPVYKYRNLCAGLSEENFKILKEKAKAFLKKPSIEFFKKRKFDDKFFLDEARKKKAKVLVLNLFSSKEKEDIAATKMRKFFEFLKKELEKKQQKVIDSKFIFLGGKYSKAYFSFILKERIRVFGPKKNMKVAIENFRKARKNIFFEKGRAFSFERFDLKEFLEKQRQVAESMDVSFCEIRPGEDSNL